MKYILSASLIVFLLSCKQNPEQNTNTSIDAATQEPMDKDAEMTALYASFPEALTEILQAHGGVEQWKKQRTLRYDMPKGELTETHTIDLWSRNDRVETEAYAMGYDGTGTWLLDPEGNYKGNPEFYHNLMFYFYAMPFVLADPGINYGETPDLEFEGVSYPGIQITYGADIGTSPKDEYYIHYDPETKQMAWLGYTVTYRTGEDSDNVKWIRYNDWAAYRGLLLPNSITWHEYEGRNIGAARNPVHFENVVVSELVTDPAHFAKPESVEYFVRPSE